VCIHLEHHDLGILSHGTLLSHVYVSPLHIYYYTTLIFLIQVPPIHRYTNSLDTLISYIDIIVTWMLDTHLYHDHTSLLHMFIAPVYMHVLFLYSCHMDHRSYYMYYYSMLSLYSCYMIVFRYWYWYSSYLIYELLICNVWNPTSIVFRFPLSCFTLSTELRSCYHVTCTMPSTCSFYAVYCEDNKYNFGMGETWRLIRSYCVDVLDPYLSHYRGW